MQGVCEVLNKANKTEILLSVYSIELNRLYDAIWHCNCYYS